jgi:hypothetical protein
MHHYHSLPHPHSHSHPIPPSVSNSWAATLQTELLPSVIVLRNSRQSTIHLVGTMQLRGLNSYTAASSSAETVS